LKEEDSAAAGDRTNCLMDAWTERERPSLDTKRRDVNDTGEGKQGRSREGREKNVGLKILKGGGKAKREGQRESLSPANLERQTKRIRVTQGKI